MRRGTRAWLRWLHLWAGVLLALPLAVTGATGIVLTWEKELAPALNGDAWSATPAGEPLSWPALVQELRGHDEGVRIAHLGGERYGDRALLTWLDTPDGFHAGLVDPYTGEFTRREPGQELLKTIEALHRNLLLGGIGRQVVAISSLAMVVVMIIGIVLWWPMRRGTVKGLTRRGALLRWHNLAGLVAAPLLVLFALTGVTLTYGGTIMPALYQLASGEPEPARPTIEPARSASETRAPLPAVFAAARAAVPDTRVQSFGEPNEPDGVYRLRMRANDSVHPNGWITVYVHPGTAEVVAVRDPRHASWAAWYDHFWYVLHTGTLLPAVPRAIWAVAAFALPALCVTGVWHWLRRRRRGRKRALRKTVSSGG